MGTMIRRILFFALLATLLPAMVWGAGPQQWIKPHRLMELIREGSALWVIDIRPAGAFAQGHIEGALHIPLELLKVKNLPANKMLVLVDDRLGLTAAGEAAELLRKKGHDKVYLLEGGMPLWEAERLPLAGTAQGRIFRQLLPEELARAGESRKKLNMYDLREKAEQTAAPLKGAEPVTGATLEQRLTALRERLLRESGKGAASRLEPVARPVVLVFPLRSEPLKELERRFQDVAGDIRYMEGGRIEAEAQQAAGKKNMTGGCKTCPGGR